MKQEKPDWLADCPFFTKRFAFHVGRRCRDSSIRAVVSDLLRRRPIWFGGTGRSEADMDRFFAWLGAAKSNKARLAVMDMWKAFRASTRRNAPKAAILFDKFHVLRHLGEAIDKVRKGEYKRLSGKNRQFIKGQKYTPLSHRQRLKPYEKFAAMIERHWGGVAAYCCPENKVALGFVEGLNTKIRELQRRAYGLRDEEYLRLKVLTRMLPPL